MTTRTQRERLRAQLVETESLSKLVEGHPVMEPSLKEKIAELKAEIDSLPPGQKEPRTILFFSGDPVHGSEGIDALFASKVIEPFQSMVMSEHAHRWHGTVGKRGPRVGEDESRLLLTGLPRGSFGLELTKAEDDELFEADELSETLAHITKLVESAARSDEDFAIALDETAPRAVQNLKQFLEIVSQRNAGLRMESGDYRCTLKPEDAVSAFERVSGTITNEEIIEVKGTFKGVLLESWRFDFVDTNGYQISGKLDDDLSQEAAVKMGREFLEHQCTATMKRTTVVYRNNRVRTTYRLVSLK